MQNKTHGSKGSGKEGRRAVYPAKGKDHGGMELTSATAYFL